MNREMNGGAQVDQRISGKDLLGLDVDLRFISIAAIAPARVGRVRSGMAVICQTSEAK